MVDFLVLPDGTVKSVQALDNSQPEFAAAAVAAVSQWTFKPGRLGGQPVTTKMRVPIDFSLSQSQPVSIDFAIGPLEKTTNLRTGSRGVIIHLEATGPTASYVQAGRFILTQAQDDTGANLEQEGTPAFYHATVGRASGDHAESTSRQPISTTLMGLAKNAKTLKVIEGKLEVFVPAQDPDATVTVDKVASRFGIPLQGPALKKAGVTLVIYDRPTAEKMSSAKTPGGPQDYDAGQMFGSDYVDPSLPPAIAQAMKDAQKKALENSPPAFAEQMRKMNEMSETEIAIGWHDPEHRIVGLEFQAVDGSPLAYNHNGYYHIERTSEKKGFDVYDLRSPLPASAKMVCWLLTNNSVIPVPLKLADLPLPEPRSEATLPPQVGAKSPVSISPP
jgi:TonB family protein